MRLLAVVGLLTVHLLAVNGVSQSGQAFCFKDGTHYRMKLSLLKNDDNVAAVYGVDVSNESVELVQECSTAADYAPLEITGDGSALTPFEVTVNIVDGVADVNCGHEAVGETYSWLFRTGSAVLLQKPSDKFFSISCDYAAIQNNMATSASVTITGDQQKTVIESIDESISLSLVDESDFVIANVALGARAKLQLTLAENNGARGLYAYSCYSGDRADFTGETYQLTDGDGCSVTSLLASGFAGVSPPYPVIRSGIFEVFRFRLSSVVYFQCKIGYCYGENDPDCANFCDSNTRRRRRRSAKRKLNAEITTSYVVVNIPHHILANKVNVTSRACLTDVGVISGFGILGALVTVSTAVAIFMFRRLSLANKKAPDT